MIVQSHGLGVDSTALTVLLFTDPRFAPYRPEAIVFSDTGAELPHTLALVLPEMNAFLRPFGQRVIVLPPDTTYRAPSKRGPLDVIYRQQHKPGIPTRRFRSCTINCKVAPIRHWLNEGDNDRRHGKWKTLGRHIVLVGIAADEAERCNGQASHVDPHAQYVETRYPLVEFGITRADCHRLLAEYSLPSRKSGCTCCPFQPLSWYWAIRELYPGLHQRSVAMENAALAWNPKLSLTGRGPLDQVIDGWVERQERQHGHLPDPRAVLAGNYDLTRKWSGSELFERLAMNQPVTPQEEAYAAANPCSI